MVSVARHRGTSSSRASCESARAGGPRVGDELLGALIEGLRLGREQRVRVLQVLLIAGVCSVISNWCCWGSGLAGNVCLLRRVSFFRVPSLVLAVLACPCSGQVYRAQTHVFGSFLGLGTHAPVFLLCSVLFADSGAGAHSSSTQPACRGDTSYPAAHRGAMSASARQYSSSRWKGTGLADVHVRKRRRVGAAPTARAALGLCKIRDEATRGCRREERHWWRSTRWSRCGAKRASGSTA